MPRLRIVTDRLILAPLSNQDALRLFEYRSDPAVCRYQLWEPRSVEEAAAFIERSGSISLDTPDAWHQLGIRLKDQGLLVGDVGVRFPEGQPLQAEFGVTLAPDGQGRGLATEAVVGLLGHLFVARSMPRVVASVYPRNGPVRGAPGASGDAARGALPSEPVVQGRMGRRRSLRPPRLRVEGSRAVGRHTGGDLKVPVLPPSRFGGPPPCPMDLHPTSPCWMPQPTEEDDGTLSRPSVDRQPRVLSSPARAS